MDSEEIIIPKKRTLLSDKEKNSYVIKRVEDNFEPFKKVIESIPSTSNHIFKSSNYNDEEKNSYSTFQFSKYDKKNHNEKKNEEDDFKLSKKVIKSTPSNSNTFKSLNYNEEKNNSMKTEVEKNLELFVIEPTPSSSNNTFKVSEYKKAGSIVNDLSSNTNSSLSIVPNLFHNVSNKNKHTNLDNTNHFHSNFIDETAITKRKLPSVCSMFGNEENDLFNYKDVDEIEEYPKKKSRKELVELVFPTILSTTSNNKCKQSKFMEPTIKNTVDPNFIMNLLAEAKGTGQFIDASKLPDKSVRNMMVVVDISEFL